MCCTYCRCPAATNFTAQTTGGNNSTAVVALQLLSAQANWKMLQVDPELAAQVVAAKEVGWVIVLSFCLREGGRPGQRQPWCCGTHGTVLVMVWWRTWDSSAGIGL
eukprot:66924-Pelagomonas_calceolata.AAC.8